MATRSPEPLKPSSVVTRLPEYYTPFITLADDKTQKAILFNKELGELDLFLNSGLADIFIQDLTRGVMSIRGYIISLNLDPKDPYFGLLIGDCNNQVANTYSLGWLGSSIRSYPEKTWHGDYDFKPFSELLEAYYNS